MWWSMLPIHFLVATGLYSLFAGLRRVFNKRNRSAVPEQKSLSKLMRGHQMTVDVCRTESKEIALRLDVFIPAPSSGDCLNTVRREGVGRERWLDVAGRLKITEAEHAKERITTTKAHDLLSTTHRWGPQAEAGPSCDRMVYRAERKVF